MEDKMDLIKALQTNDGLTENGALTHTTSSDATTDLFFQVGAFRHQDEQAILARFNAAFAASPLDAMRILFYARDVRGGQGERRTFRIILKNLAINQPEVVAANLHLIPEYGRWDDVLILLDTPLSEMAINLIKTALLENEDALCAKWMPREKSANKVMAKRLIRALGLSPKAYRKLLSRLTMVVETPMCQNEWGSITFEHVPSYAMKTYRKAFARHDEERWGAYLESLVSGQTKVNASTLFPHDLIRQIKYNATDKLIEQQWKALPNYMATSDERILPMCDVSGSMTMYGGIPMDVSVSLGLYISERNKGIFKDAVLTFTNKPTLYTLKGQTLHQRWKSLMSNVGYNTNIDAAFNTLLDAAVTHGVSPEKMPTMILILSDMEFDSNEINGKSMTAMNAVRARYQKAGYELPKIVFWNLAARHGNFPVKYDERGVALVSGFSPSILKQLLAGQDFTPVGIMRQTIDSKRYEAVTV
jgi:hypothetical protein